MHCINASRSPGRLFVLFSKALTFLEYHRNRYGCFILSCYVRPPVKDRDRLRPSPFRPTSGAQLPDRGLKKSVKTDLGLPAPTCSPPFLCRCHFTAAPRNYYWWEEWTASFSIGSSSLSSDVLSWGQHLESETHEVIDRPSSSWTETFQRLSVLSAQTARWLSAHRI